MEYINTRTKIHSIMIHYYSYLVIQSKVKLTHTETQHPPTHRVACTHARTHTYTHTHARTLAHTHARTHARTHTHTHTRAYTRTHTHAHTRTHSHIHTHTHTHAHTHTRARARARSRNVTIRYQLWLQCVLQKDNLSSADCRLLTSVSQPTW